MGQLLCRLECTHLSTSEFNSRKISLCIFNFQCAVHLQEDVQREALRDDEERRKRSEQMRKERAAVRICWSSVALCNFGTTFSTCQLRSLRVSWCLQKLIVSPLPISQEARSLVSKRDNNPRSVFDNKPRSMFDDDSSASPTSPRSPTSPSNKPPPRY